MSRLYDRIRGFGCEAFRPYHLASDAEQTAQRRANRGLLVEQADRDADPVKIAELADYAGSRQFQVSNSPIATEVFDAVELDGIPVFAADEVGAYCAELPNETRLEDVVTTVAPPFEHFFVEFQNVSNPRDFNAWGVMVDQVAYDPAPAGDAAWQVLLRLIVERDKNAPIGPVVNLIFPLTRDGHLIVEEGDELASGVWLPPMKPENPPEEIVKETADSLMTYMLPAFMTISFMHCKNVDVREIEPHEGQSKRWSRKRGHPLATYHVLEIGPMRRVLEGEGDSGSQGLKHALHVCRGHFKTFSEEAPLFGRTTGTFWWADQVRGAPEVGEVAKDYEVRAPGTMFGRPYERADEEPELAQADRLGPDPDAAGRGLAAHNRTQNLLADAVEAAGMTPRRPGDGEPNFDLAWDAGRAIRVAEVKSVTEKTEERQLRMALGQVVRYRQQLAATGREVRALIALERAPDDSSWIDLCQEQGILLCWPDTFAQAVGSER